MSWFKVDDSFYDHPKVIQLSNAAIGLWLRCGSWCARYETDGVIPAFQVKAFKGTKGPVDALVDAGLWTVEGVGKEKIYIFHDWDKYQPSSESRQRRRQIARDSMRRSRGQKTENEELFAKNFAENSEKNRENFQKNAKKNHSAQRGELQEVENVDCQQAVNLAGARVPTRPVVLKGGSNLTVPGGDVYHTPSFDNFDDETEAAVAAFAASLPDAPPVPASQAAPTPPPAVGKYPADWSTPEDPRCRLHAHWQRDQVPACRECGRARKWFEQQKQAARDARWAAIEACEMCDERGLVTLPSGDGSSVVARCDHKTRPNSRLIAPPERFEQKSNPECRRRLLAPLRARWAQKRTPATNRGENPTPTHHRNHPTQPQEETTHNQTENNHTQPNTQTENTFEQENTPCNSKSSHPEHPDPKAPNATSATAATSKPADTYQVGATLSSPQPNKPTTTNHPSPDLHTSPQSSSCPDPNASTANQHHPTPHAPTLISCSEQ